MKGTKGRKGIIVGASSGIGQEVARQLLAEGWRLGIAARREDKLLALKAEAPEQVEVLTIDITRPEAEERLLSLIRQVGGMDLYVHASGIGFQNRTLEPETELRTVETNAMGFTRMVGAAYRYMARQAENGATGMQIAAITSIAGTKGLGPAPAYSATKALQACYLEALQQQANMRRLPITFTDIRPGFVDTALLGGTFHYPMLMQAGDVARDIVQSIHRRRHVRVIDWRYRWLTALWRHMPRWLWRRLTFLCLWLAAGSLLTTAIAQSTHWRIEAESPATRVLLRNDTLDMTAPQGLSLWWSQPVEAPCQIRYKAMVVMDDGPCDRLSDMNCFWMATELGESPLKGAGKRKGKFVESYRLQCYYLGYGGNHNSTTRFRRYDGDSLAVQEAGRRPTILQEYTDAGHLLLPNHWYDICIEVLEGGRTRYSMDGECLVDYVDQHPLQRGWFAFRTTWSHTRLTDFKISHHATSDKDRP